METQCEGCRERDEKIARLRKLVKAARADADASEAAYMELLEGQLRERP